MMQLTAEQRHLAKLIDEHVCKFPESDSGNEQLLTTVYDYMEAFKIIMDSTTRLQMDYLSQQYPGFHRFGKLLESIAQGISTGDIEVPRDH